MTIVADILERKGSAVTSVAPDATVLEAARLMNRERIGGLVVYDDIKGVMGVFTERDVMRRVVSECKSPVATKVSEVMSTPVTYCRPETTMQECQSIMTSKRLRHLPVIVDGDLVGMISTGDIMMQEVQEQQNTIEYLHEYIHGRT